MSEKLDKLRASLEKERERRIKINTRIESLERRIQEAEAAEVNEMVRTAKVTPEQLAALLRQSATSTPTPAALSAVGATFNKEESDNEDPGQCDGQSGYGVTTLDAVVESIVCMKFEEILECSKSNLLEEMRRKDLDAAKKEATRWKEEVQTKVDEQDALKKEMIRVIQGTSGLDREMIQQMVNENKEALLTAQTNLADSEKKLKEIEEQNQKAERNCSDLFTWASTYKEASFERRQAILKQFIKEVRVGRDYNIEIVLNVPLDEFEEFKRHAASAGRGKNQKNKSQNPQKVGRCTSNAGIVVLDKTAGETISIVPKNAAHAILRC